MEIKTLENFLTIVQMQTISKAAKKLHIAQPHLSRQMRDLEKELGKQLFIRGQQKIELTEEGILLQRYATEILNLVNQAKTKMQDNQTNDSIQINIGIEDNFSNEIIANILNNLYQDPHIILNLVYDSTPNLLKRIDQNLLDCALVFDHPKMKDYNFISLQIETKWGLICKKDDSLANMHLLSLNNLEKQPLIVSHTLINHLNNQKLDIKKLNIIMITNQITHCFPMIKKQIGYIITTQNHYNQINDFSLCFKELIDINSSKSYCILKKDINDYKFKLIFNSLISNTG